MENTKKPIDFLPDFSQDYVGELFHERGFAGGGGQGTMRFPVKPGPERSESHDRRE